MRVIKFRAWDQTRNKICRVSSVHFADDGMQIWMIGGKGILDKVEPKNTILMQFTGLLDKNGKEIFEGDIFKNGSLVRAITVDEQHGYRFHFGLDRLTRGDADYGEVIGNIYENPELLK